MSFERAKISQKGISLVCTDGFVYPLGIDNEITEFKYIEDFNLGYPIVELVMPMVAYDKVNEHIAGSEIIRINNLTYDEFKLTGDFRVKSIGIATPIRNKPGHVNFVKFIAHHMDQERLMNLNEGIVPDRVDEKRISDLVRNAHKKAGCKLKPNIEPTKPFRHFSMWNLYIPPVLEAQKVIRRLTYLSMDEYKRGGYMYFYNREGMYFEPAWKVMSRDSGYKINVLEGQNEYIMNELTISPHNDFPSMALGGNKRIYALKYTIKEMWTYSATTAMTYPLPYTNLTITTGNATRNSKPYFTHIDNEDQIKAFAESLYLSQIFNINMEMHMMCNKCKNFKIGDVIKVNLKNASPNQETYHNMSGKWLIKSMVFKYVEFAVNLELKLVRAGINHVKGTYEKV